MLRGPQTCRPLAFTLSAVLKALARLTALNEGAQIHSHVFKFGFHVDPRVLTALLGFYAKCGRIVDARKLFDEMAERGVGDVQVWNTMVAGYAADGDVDSASSLFERMPERNTITWVEMIGGYAALGKMDATRRLFEMCKENGEADRVVCTAMISNYAKCGDVAAARTVFNEMNERDVASWNAMISAYSNAGSAGEALDLFKLMLSGHGGGKVEPNHSTIATVVSVCAQFGSPNLANWIQGYVDRCGSRLLNNHTVAALIDLHSKCGDLERAYDLFSKWKHKDLICYSSMIAGFGIHGCGMDAIKVFDSLLKSGLRPDSICFVSVLTACSHAGMLAEGRRYFQIMKDEYCIAPNVEHYMCFADLLGRAGCIDEAYRLITNEMPPGVRPNAGVWGALLSACRTYSNVEVAEEAARHLMELEPENAGNYVLLSNIYAKARRWDEAARVRARMRGRGMRKPPGWSWAEVGGGEARKFLTEEVYDGRVEMMLQLLDWELRDQGYVPTIEKFE